jgi:hypothetical protein
LTKAAKYHILSPVLSKITLQVIFLLEKTIRITMLFDFYGSLLTDKQQQIIKNYFYNDLSLAEIAANLEISRQGVYDHLHRSEENLEEYESKLGLLAKYNKLRQQISELETILVNKKFIAGNNNCELGQKLETIKSLL